MLGIRPIKTAGKSPRSLIGNRRKGVEYHEQMEEGRKGRGGSQVMRYDLDSLDTKTGYLGTVRWGGRTRTCVGATAQKGNDFWSGGETRIGPLPL